MITRMNRRTFLARAAAASAALSAMGLTGCGARSPGHRAEAPRLSPDQWRTAAAAQALMLPSKPGSPGAVEVQATAYLDAALAEAQMDAGDRAAVKAGLSRLDALAQARGAAHFAALGADAQATALTALLAEKGPWFRVVMAFTMEAFLGDPTHGGNPDGIGWTWVGHPAPYPQPKPKPTPKVTHG
jgi:gluconate 2-dehydrogenase gamma chain